MDERVTRAGRRPATAEDPTGARTRERILDIALDLFSEKGFDKSSLREIAEQLGTSKAAIYYYFASKDDILMALHQRLHEILGRTVAQLGGEPTGVDSWAALLDTLVGEMLTHRKIFVMHDRNRSAFEELHRHADVARHRAEHEDLDDEVRRMIGNRSLPLRDRVRMGCAIGAVIAALVIYGDVLRDVPAAELEGLLRDAIDDLLGRRARRGRPVGRRTALIGRAEGDPAQPTRRPSRSQRRTPR